MPPVMTISAPDSEAHYFAHANLPRTCSIFAALHPFSIILLLLEVGALIEVGVCLFGAADNTFPPTRSATWAILLANFVIGATRVVWLISTAAVQARAVRAALIGSDTTARRSPYVVLIALRAIGMCGSAAELGLAIALSCALADVLALPSAALAVLCSATRWVVCAVRLVLAPAEPLRWNRLLSGSGASAVSARRAHLSGRIASIERPLLCLSCIAAPGGQFAGADVAALVALVGADVFGGGTEEAVSFLRVAAGLELVRLSHAASTRRYQQRPTGEATTAASSEDAIVESRHPLGAPLSDRLRVRCVAAVEMHHYALGAYTGVLLDCARVPALGWLCWLRDQCCCAIGAGGGDTAAAHAPVVNDNCWSGHRRSFLNYCGVSGARLIAGKLAHRPGLVTYFCLRKDGERQLVIALRGTETMTDVVTDGLAASERVSPADLGLGPEEAPAAASVNGGVATTPHMGYAFSGILGAVRAMAAEMLPALTHELESGGARGYTVVIAGHSLGGSAAGLLALRLRPTLLASGASAVHAFCYNPLPCLSREGLAAVAAARSHAAGSSASAGAEILSFVMRDDFSSRLSVRRLRRLVIQAKQASDGALDLGGLAPLARFAKFFSTISCRCLLRAGEHVRKIEVGGRARAVDVSGADRPHGTPVGASPAGDIEGAVDAGRVDADEDEDEELYLVGNVVHVRGTPGRMEVVSVPASSFRDLCVTPTFLLDHVPWMLPVELSAALGCSYERRSWDRARAYATGSAVSPRDVLAEVEDAEVVEASAG